MTSTSRKYRSPADISRALFWLTAAWFGLCALLYNSFTMGAVARIARAATGNSDIPAPSGELLRSGQFAFVVAAAACVGVALMGKLPPLSRLLAGKHAPKIVLGLGALLVPFASAEIALRPTVKHSGKSTSLFVKDERLGWKLRPNADDNWGDTRVVINSRGLRGPEVPYQRTDAFRILYLGDSVTFGYTLERAEDAYPFVVARELTATTGQDVETINAGVGGYSPWQYLAYLEDEGLKYQPDVVVIGFVLNDVTEKFHLTRFGGNTEGFQLRESAYSTVERVLSASALVTQTRRISRMWKARRKLGDDVQLGAIQQEMLDVHALIDTPNSETVQRAWELTLQNMRNIYATCAANDIDVLTVVFPFRVQLDDPDNMNAPQRHIVTALRADSLAVWDVLPALVEACASGDITADDIFVDHDHFTKSGSELVGKLIAAELQQRESSN